MQADTHNTTTKYTSTFCLIFLASFEQKKHANAHADTQQIHTNTHASDACIYFLIQTLLTHTHTPTHIHTYTHTNTTLSTINNYKILNIYKHY